MKKFLKSKNIILSAVFLIGASYCFFNHSPEPEKPDKIKYALETNKLLKRCQNDTRELDFLIKGGEYLVDYDNPRTLNDKVGYILHHYFHKSPVTSVIGNKYLAKKYVTDAVGEKYVVRLLGIWDNPSDINWQSLPNKFVLKSVRGHFGQQVILVNDKSKLDIPATIKKLEKFCEVPGMREMKKNRILAEEYLETKDALNIDYKFFCSYGKAFVAYCLATDKKDISDVSDKTLAFYSVPDWKRLPVIVDGHRQNLIPKPKNFKLMLELAEKLSKPFPLIRIDLYEIDDRILVGELTEDASGAKSIFSPVIWDFKLGEMINVPTLQELEEIIKIDKQKYKITVDEKM